MPERPAPPPACHDATGDALCGGGDCVLLTDTEVMPAYETGDAPSITLDERGNVAILVENTTGLGPYTSVLARLSGSGWSDLDVPGAALRGTLAFGEAGPLVVAVDDGSFHTKLWTVSDSFAPGDPVPTDQTISSGNVWRDARGDLHLVASAHTGPHYTTDRVLYLHYDGSFDTTSLDAGPADVAGGALALGPSGAPNVAWIRQEPTGAEEVRWWTSGVTAPETAFTGVGPFGSGPSITVGVDVRRPSGEAPWIAFVDQTGALLLTTPSERSGDWRTTMVTPPFDPSSCAAGHTCTTPPVPFDVLPSCDGPRVVYGFGRVDADGSVAAVVAMARLGSTSDAEILVEHSAAGGFRGHAVREASGNIHVAYWAGPFDDGTVDTRYLRIGAAP